MAQSYSSEVFTVGLKRF